MITPKFSIDQTNDFVFVKIHAPYIKAPLIQFEVSENIFVFSLPPYYLRLRFPGQLIEDEFMESKYDVQNGDITCRVSKLNKNEHFEDLDMISKLLATKSQTEIQEPKKPKIEVVSSNSNGDDGSDDDDVNNNSEPELELEQSEFNELTSKTKYGFNNLYNERIGLSIHLGNDINELDDPESGDSESRYAEFQAKIPQNFDQEYFLADHFDNEMIGETLTFKFPDVLKLDDDLQDQLLKLANREYLIDDVKSIYLGLVPLLFGWCYDFRTNFGDHTVESYWNIGKLSPSLCYLFNGYHSMFDVVKDVTIRSISKPLYRHWDLTMTVWKDVIRILQMGKREVLKILVNTLKLFENECHHYYRQVLLEDYCVWIQQSSDKVLNSVALELSKTVSSFSRKDLNLRLDEIIKDALDSADALDIGNSSADQCNQDVNVNTGDVDSDDESD